MVSPELAPDVWRRKRPRFPALADKSGWSAETPFVDKAQTALPSGVRVRLSILTTRAPPTLPRVASRPGEANTLPTNDTTPARSKRGALGGGIDDGYGPTGGSSRSATASRISIRS
jgi:hypothetical protein